MLCVRIPFNPDSDPAFHRNVDPDSGRKTVADPRGSGSESWSDLKVIKNSLNVGNRSKSILAKVKKAI